MKIIRETVSYYGKWNDFHLQLNPSIAIGKSKGWISLHLYVLFWEFSVGLEYGNLNE